MTEKLFFIAIILSLAAGCTSANVDVRPVMGAAGQESVGDAATLLEQGKSEFAANRFGLAIRQFRMALNIDPHSTSAMNGLAACYDKLGRFDIAGHFYRSALTLAPNSTAILNNIGYSYYLQKKFDLAVVYLREAANRDEDNNPLISANLHIVDITLRKTRQRPPRGARRQAVSASRGLDSSHPGPKQEKALRLVRSGSATYTLYTGPAPNSRQSAVRGGSGRDRVAVDHGSATLAKPAEMHFAAAGKPPNAVLSPPAIIVVANGTGRRMMAARTARHLKANGHRVTSLVNAGDFEKRVSRILYKPGQETAARAVSMSLHSIPRLVRREDQIAALYIELGADLLNFDRQLIHLYKKQTEKANHADL